MERGVVHGFEYGVILNGSQTIGGVRQIEALFEYGVILNGSQTFQIGGIENYCLSIVLFWIIMSSCIK